MGFGLILLEEKRRGRDGIGGGMKNKLVRLTHGEEVDLECARYLE
jgi:hypothetical protein